MARAWVIVLSSMKPSNKRAINDRSAWLFVAIAVFLLVGCAAMKIRYSGSNNTVEVEMMESSPTNCIHNVK